MNTDLAATEIPDFMTTLTEAVRKRSDCPSASAVVLALLQAEKAAKQQRIAYPLESLLGNWQLWFTAPRKAHLQNGKALGKGLYLPQIAPAQISFFNQEQLSISNQIQFGSLLFKLTGSAKYVGKKNLLAFDFTQMQISLFGRTIYHGKFPIKTRITNFYEQPIAKLPFFAFFLVTEDFIAARGRGGGIAIWVRN
ncbi:hypothetical protein [Gloeocapsopsis dulcis]|uniref:PAP fibrillin n=1 Tax=Gloeocapsopsis dulcis AAB1 = 1H9 TaxID=1433147 RepID=A0A6N8FQV8_9CHRO|nr:hypothetical protein [Gloeocapsopsis dulcis]MUL35184.1 hypothetical protein [Gloeocapsopsis dulcis AAB1 = 1H9]WNN89069.1 hypothetical protein P0S91_22915 [Gloeocapsopsis dulcis]